MARSNILGGDTAPSIPEGSDADRLGPSDSSDSGSDIQGARRPDTHADSDAAGTGERGSALPDEGVEDARDIAPDHIETLGPESPSDLDDSSADATRDRATGLAADEDVEEEDDPDSVA
jgi:hypothetical protein